ncbi:winged helix-turn-helix domain-containing protein [Nocardia farcinica]|uniref:winged helix-turn-helix domain-containing protein n=2 Tax=Nocardiaceae TaxID=85025 RepID=UPI0034DD9F87
MRLFDLQVLHELRAQSKLSATEIAHELNRTLGETRAGLNRMLEEGLVEQRGTGSRRIYHLSAAVYRAMDNSHAYVRIRGTESIQHEQMVLQYVESFGPITRGKAAELCLLTPSRRRGCWAAWSTEESSYGSASARRRCTTCRTPSVSGWVAG